MVDHDRIGRVPGAECRHRNPRPRMHPAAHQVEPRYFAAHCRALERCHHPMWGTPVERPGAGREQIREVLRHRERAGRWLRAEVQTEMGQTSEGR